MDGPLYPYIRVGSLHEPVRDPCAPCASSCGTRAVQKNNACSLRIGRLAIFSSVARGGKVKFRVKKGGENSRGTEGMFFKILGFLQRLEGRKEKVELVVAAFF